MFFFILDTLYFLVRYTPFWSIPLFFISLEYFREYLVRGLLGVALGFLSITIFTAVSFLLYFYYGTPDKAIDGLNDFLYGFGLMTLLN